MEYNAWILRTGLRDAVEAISPALEWARRYCFLWSRARDSRRLHDGRISATVEMTQDEWNQGIILFAEKFDRLPLPEKFRHLTDTYRLPRLELTDHILSINQARNCLTHRNGIVGTADVREGADAMVVRRRRAQLRVEREGTLQDVDLIGASIEPGDAIGLVWTDTDTRYPIGSRVTFSNQEFKELCMTHLLFALELDNAVRALSALPERAEKPEP